MTVNEVRSMTATLLSFSPANSLFTSFATTMPFAPLPASTDLTYLASLVLMSKTSTPFVVRSATYRRCAAWSIWMRSMDAVLPLSGGIGILVSETTVVSAATGGSKVGCGVGAPDAPGVAEGLGLGDGVGAAVVATATTVGAADGPAAVPPHGATRIAPAERIADRRIGRAVIGSPPLRGGRYAERALRGGSDRRRDASAGTPT